MKKLLILLLLAATALCIVGCGSKPVEPTTAEPTANAEPSAQRHTIPPSETQLEWAPVDCDIALCSAEAILIGEDDFLTFALAGSTDEDCALRFALSESGAGVLSAQQTAGGLHLTVDGKPLNGTLTFSDDCSEITMTGGYTYEEMCRLATAIRGL